MFSHENICKRQICHIPSVFSIMKYITYPYQRWFSGHPTSTVLPHLIVLEFIISPWKCGTQNRKQYPDPQEHHSWDLSPRECRMLVSPLVIRRGGPVNCQRFFIYWCQIFLPLIYTSHGEQVILFHMYTSLFLVRVIKIFICKVINNSFYSIF